MKTWEAAMEVLRETGNDSVMLGDSGLLDSIYERAELHGASHQADRWKKVLDSLSRAPGPFVAKKTHDGHGWVRVFRLEPKPCPFCDGPGFLTKIEPVWEGKVLERYTAGCKNRECRVSPRIERATWEGALLDWNLRSVQKAPKDIDKR